MIPEQQALFQSDVDTVVAELKIPGTRGKVRLYGGGTYDDGDGTVVEYDPHWVAEVRIGRSKNYPIAVVDCEGAPPSPHDSTWIEILRDEVQSAARSLKKRQR